WTQARRTQCWRSAGGRRATNVSAELSSEFFLVLVAGRVAGPLYDFGVITVPLILAHAGSCRVHLYADAELRRRSNGWSAVGFRSCCCGRASGLYAGCQAKWTVW